MVTAWHCLMLTFCEGLCSTGHQDLTVSVSQAGPQQHQRLTDDTSPTLEQWRIVLLFGFFFFCLPQSACVSLVKFTTIKYQ